MNQQLGEIQRRTLDVSPAAMFEGTTVTVFDGRFGELLLGPVPVERAVVLAAVKTWPGRVASPWIDVISYVAK
jgi:hypothetical protein